MSHEDVLLLIAAINALTASVGSISFALWIMILFKKMG